MNRKIKLDLNNYEKNLEFDDSIILKNKKNENYQIYNELVLLLGTSGSTGSKKFVRISKKNLYSNTENISNYLKIKSDDITITTLPPQYTYGLSIINSHIFSGSAVCINNSSFMEKLFWEKANKFKVNNFVYSLWSEWKTNGYIKTPILKRVLSKDNLSDMNQNKLFNYYLQALETEFTVNRLHQLSNLLKKYKTCIILYTYDSVLFDIPIEEAKKILPQIKSCLEGNDFPVKCKVGNIYSKMNDFKL